MMSSKQKNDLNSSSIFLHEVTWMDIQIGNEMTYEIFIKDYIIILYNLLSNLNY